MPTNHVINTSWGTAELYLQKCGVWFWLPLFCLLDLFREHDELVWKTNLANEKKNTKNIWPSCLLGELNQLFMIKWGQGDPWGKVGLPPLHSSKLLPKFRTASWKFSQFLHAIWSDCQGASAVLHTTLLLFPFSQMRLWLQDKHV